MPIKKEKTGTCNNNGIDLSPRGKMSSLIAKIDAFGSFAAVLHLLLVYEKSMTSEKPIHSLQT